MAINQLDLLKVRRFFPLFLTQFLGAFNDNVYKNALVILITYTLATQFNENAQILVTVAAGIFILPFFLFSATAGQLADKYEKSLLIRYTKLAEVFLMILAGIGFYHQSIFLLMLVLFLLGTQATFFGPMKYSILPDHLKNDELIAGNALIESGTFLAILLGTIFGGVLAAFHIGPTLVTLVVLTIAVGGLIASIYIPKASIAAPNLKINYNVIQESWNIVKTTFVKRDVFLSILGISWFWLVGATYLSQFPTYAKNVLGASSSIVTLMLTCFTMGIGMGSLFCNRLLKGKVTATYVPLATLGMAILGVDLVIASHIAGTNEGELVTLWGFLSHIANWHILIDLVLLAICGGIYIVPLYAIVQQESDPTFRSRAIAANNIMNALFMVVAALATTFLLAIDLSVTHVFLLVAIANLFVAIYICRLLPEEFVKSCLIWVFKTFYRVQINGLENYYKAGERVLIVSNHTSFLDAALLAAFIPDRLTFAIDTQIAKKWWMQMMLKLVNTFSVDPTNSMATKSLIEYLREHKNVVIFPEGRITVTGALMKIYEGPGLIADKAEATMLPIRIDGAQYTPFSYLKGKVRLRWFPKIKLTILPPRKFDLPDSITGRERRQIISAKLYDIMTETMFISSNNHETLFQSLLNAKEIHGKKHVIVEDIERKPMNYQRLIMSSFILGRRIAKKTSPNEYVGILLPNSIANLVTLFGMQAYHRVPAMLNFSTGINNILSACSTAKLKTIYTSKRFVELAELQQLIQALTNHGMKIIYLENVRQSINIFHKLTGWLVSQFPEYHYHRRNNITEENMQEHADKPGIVLFTSGSEGLPKGVVLSHTNMQSNRYQLTACVDFNPTDKIFNSLPMFHSFGLNSATLLPVLSGIRTFLYPSPLHYRIVPELCYDTNATIFFGTDTFLSNYAKYAHPYNFYSVRYVFAGAEKLREDTRNTWLHKFGIRIMEGYGATEASPVISTNTAMQYRLGSVGRILPGINYQLETVEGVTQGAKLVISGPNIMMGYLYAHTPGVIVPPVDGWYDTGDIVSVDDDGYISIKGRVKRFAKIAGEMVSLTAIEEELNLLWPKNQHAVMCIPDERKGEQIVLVTNFKQATQGKILEMFKLRGVAEIGLPRKIIMLDKVPVLGSGKVDYQTIKTLLASHLDDEPIE